MRAASDATEEVEERCNYGVIADGLMGKGERMQTRESLAWGGRRWGDEKRCSLLLRRVE